MTRPTTPKLGRIRAALKSLRSRTVRFFAVITPGLYALVEALRASTAEIRELLPEDWSKYLLAIAVAGGIYYRSKTTTPLNKDGEK